MTQRIAMRLGDPAGEAVEGPPVIMPDLLLAAEPGWLAPGTPFPARGLVLRLRAGEEDDVTLEEACKTLAEGGTLDLEVVLPQGTECGPTLDALALRLARTGLFPRHVAALPEAQFGASLDAPDAPTPRACVEAATASFPEARVGLGVLGNFAGDRRPDAEGLGQYVTLGSSAAGQGADDAAVLEALEVLPQVFADARGAAGSRALRLGLVSIGMRPLPSGANGGAGGPGRAGTGDPRQRGLIAAAFAVAACAAAAEAGAEAVALAAPAGPFGLLGPSGETRPLFHVLAALHPVSGRLVRLDALPGLRGLSWEEGAVLANASLTPVTIPAPFPVGAVLCTATLEAARDPAWLDRAAGPLPERLTLDPCEVLFAGKAAQSL